MQQASLPAANCSYLQLSAWLQSPHFLPCTCTHQHLQASPSESWALLNASPAWSCTFQRARWACGPWTTSQSLEKAWSHKTGWQNGVPKLSYPPSSWWSVYGNLQSRVGKEERMNAIWRRGKFFHISCPLISCISCSQQFCELLRWCHRFLLRTWFTLKLKQHNNLQQMLLTTFL